MLSEQTDDVSLGAELMKKQLLSGRECAQVRHGQHPVNTDFHDMGVDGHNYWGLLHHVVSKEPG